MIKSEERHIGNVPFKIYKLYITSGGFAATFFMISFFLLAQASKLVSDWWLGIWSDRTYHLTTNQYIGIYGGLAIAITFFMFMRGVMFGLFTLKIAN